MRRQHTPTDLNAAGDAGRASTAAGTPESFGTICNGVSPVSEGYPAPSGPCKPSRAQLALVHVAKKTLAMDDETYRAFLFATAGVRSARDLSASGFEAVMRRFEALGFVPGTPLRPALPQYGQRPGMATPAQMAVIRKGWRAWSGNDSAQTLRAWLESKFHISDLRFCSVTTAQKAIEALKAMHARKAPQSNTRAPRAR